MPSAGEGRRDMPAMVTETGVGRLEGYSPTNRYDDGMRYDPHTALIVVDVQNDFADPRGSLAVRGGEAVVHAVNIEVAAANAAGGAVVYTRDWHPESTPHFAKDGGLWPVHCVAGTWGAEAPAALYSDGPVVRKGSHGEDGYSGFSMRDPLGGETIPTELDGLLRTRQIERVVIAGLATDHCVLATALDARSLGYATTVLRDAIAAVDLEPDDGQRALDEMRAAGVTIE
jgi:nicotinamidase/pyrazinamidase